LFQESQGIRLPSSSSSDVLSINPNFTLKFRRKISEHFPFPGCLSIQEGKMAGQAVLGETVLKDARAIETATTVETLVADHARMVFRIAYSILRNHHDAEDAAQECFLRVVKYKDLHKVRNRKTWLARVAWTTALDKKRSSRDMASLDDESAQGTPMLEALRDSAPAADDQIADRQLQVLLERLIGGLPEELRCPLELSTIEELNSAEISEIMRIPEASVRTRLFRARKQLREKLSALMETSK
jgi:RNA polymerase sigma-70 factor (ECF subfamily)